MSNTSKTENVMQANFLILKFVGFKNVFKVHVLKTPISFLLFYKFMFLYFMKIFFFN